MKAAAITGPHQAQLADLTDPRPIEEMAVVAVRAAPMCAEYKQFVSGDPCTCLGHEAAGEVTAVAQPGRVKVGDRVVVMPLQACGRCPLCRGGNYIYCPHGRQGTPPDASANGGAYAQFLVQSDWLLMPIPPGVSYEHASMACCGLGPTFGAMEAMNVGAGDSVLITGAGPVGLGGVIHAAYRGARAIVIEGNLFRAELACKLGAEHVLDPGSTDVLSKIRDLAGGGVDMAIDCSGVPAAHRLCIDAARIRGQVCFVGESYAYGQTSLWASPDMIRKGLTLRGNWHYNIAGYDKLMKVIRASSPQLNQLITHRLGLSQVQQAFEISASGQCGKIVLNPWR